VKAERRLRPERRLRAVVCVWSVILMGVAGLPSAWGQEEGEEPELATDRPDFTETSYVVPLHSLQVEGGVTYSDEPDGTRVLSGPELLMRYGIGARTELRFGVMDYIHVRGEERTSGFGDAYLGFKQQLAPTGARMAWAVIPAVTIPTGANRLTSDHVDPEIVLTWARDLNETWSVGGIVGYAWLTEDGERNGTLVPTVAFGRPLSERWGMFIEWAAAFPERGGDVHMLHHGYTYGLRKNAQLDVHLGFGLSDAAPDFFIGAGFAFRR
jgi:hypothetical protein